MITYRNVTITRRDAQPLIQNVNLSVGEGEFVYLIGKVGSGKSSLLKTLYSDLDIRQGEEARVLGEYDLLNLRKSQIPHLRRKLGIVFQDFQLLTDRTVEANLDFVLRATGWDKTEYRRQRIEEVLQLVGMSGCEKRMPNTLSGGEQQRIVIARALLNNPKLILADEPTGNLDPETGKNIVKLLYDICREKHATVIMSTHNLSYTGVFPGRVIRIENGVLSEESESLSAVQEEASEALGSLSAVLDEPSEESEGLSGGQNESSEESETLSAVQIEPSESSESLSEAKEDTTED